MEPAKPKLAVIVGPTAVGKSAIALEIASGLGAEIVTADSQQVYRYMDIGTGKPTSLQRRSVPHHLIDVVDPDEPFNAAMFRRLARASVAEIHGRGKRVLVCGGTGLYVKALIRGLFTGSPADPAIRGALRAEAERTGWKALYERLQRIDPEAVRRIHPNDRHRTMRALEVFELTGKPLSEWQKEHAFTESCFDTITIGLDRDRAELYEAINRRCDEMIEAGLLGELTALVARGYGLDLPALQSVGYRHMGMVLRGELPLESATDLMKRDTRRLAKRQWTWFRNDRETRWFHPAETARIRAVVERFFEEIPA